MLGANVPVHHWDDAILTAGFLINRMPSSSLENKIPYSILFPNEALFLVSRIFGSTCFVQVSLGRDKLFARAIKCVFLGYSCLQKGYHCYSPDIRRYYMSPNATFEETPFFSSSMQDFNSVQHVLLVLSIDPLLSPVHEIPITDTSQATSPTSPSCPSSSPNTTHQYETHRELSSPMSHGESSTLLFFIS